MAPKYNSRLQSVKEREYSQNESRRKKTKMSLWVDKYRPNSLSKLDYHLEQAERLQNMVVNGNFPHLLVYGPSGAGKKTRIMALLRELYGPGVEKLRMEHQTFTVSGKIQRFSILLCYLAIFVLQTPSNKKIEVMTVASNYHIEVNPSDAGMYDRIVVQEMIKTIAQTQQLDSHGQREFKGINIKLLMSAHSSIKYTNASVCL